MAWWTCCTGELSSTWARPSFSAATATATPTAAETRRRLSTGGRSAAPSVMASEFGDRVGGRLQHWFVDAPGFGHGHTQAQAREDQGVVGLGDLVGATLVGNRRKGAAGGDQGPSLGPADQVLGQHLAL
jgi:hypothetical protein